MDRELGGDGVVVGFVDVAADFAVSDSERASGEDVVERADDHVCAGRAVASRVFKPGGAQALHDRLRAGAVFGVEIAGDHNWCFFRVLPGVFQHLVELRELDGSRAAAFEVEVINDQSAGVILEFANEGDPSAKTSLKQSPGGNIRARLPETGLVLETNHPGAKHGKRGQDGLAMVGGIVAAALGKLLELGSKNVVEFQTARELGGDVGAVGAARVQIHFLEDDEVGALAFNGVGDTWEVIPTVDVPVQDA